MYTPPHISSFHSSVSGRLGGFHVLAVVDGAAVDVGVPCVLLNRGFSGCVPRSGTAGLYGSSPFSFFRNLRTSPQEAESIYIPTNRARELVPFSLHPFQHLFSQTVSAMAVLGCEVPHCQFGLHSLPTQCTGSFTCPWGICLSSLGKCLFTSWVHSLIGLFTARRSPAHFSDGEAEAEKSAQTSAAREGRRLPWELGLSGPTPVLFTTPVSCLLRRRTSRSTHRRTCKVSPGPRDVPGIPVLPTLLGNGWGDVLRGPIGHHDRQVFLLCWKWLTIKLNEGRGSERERTCEF